MSKLDDIAAHIAASWSPRAAFAPLTGALAPADISEAYAAQTAAHVAMAPLRGAIVGRKIALASKAMQEFCGIDHPIAGAVYAFEMRPSPATVRLADFCNLGLEFELALTLSRDLAPGDGPFDAASALPLIGAARPAFELIEDRAADYAKLDVPTMVADNAWCGGVIFGPEIEGWRGADLEALPARLSQTGVDAVDGSTAPTSPVASFAWVINNALERGLTLSAGEIIITGSVETTRYPKTGESFVFEIAGASVEATFV